MGGGYAALGICDVLGTALGSSLGCACKPPRRWAVGRLPGPCTWGPGGGKAVQLQAWPLQVSAATATSSMASCPLVSQSYGATLGSLPVAVAPSSASLSPGSVTAG